MCGILGVYQNNSSLNKEYFSSCLNSMAFRGPDDSGVEKLNENLIFGHRRLSIIDLSANGHQPMFSEDKTYAIVFNGEIYNYKSLKVTLENLGHSFRSNTDTEVILQGYIEWGLSNLLERLKGMFSFVIYDKAQNKLIGARDRFGMKPFYYHHSEYKFGFSSSLKALKSVISEEPSINQEALIDYFNYSHIPNPQTIWKDFHKLPPAHCFHFDLSESSLIIKKYWELKTGNAQIPLKEASNQFDELLEASIRDHLVSDVPVGLFLSGGYDSSAVLDKMAKYTKGINTFSIGFEGSDRSEHLVAEKLAKIYQTNHQALLVKSSDDPMTWMEELVDYLDEPYAISSMIPYFLVSKLAAKHNKVVLVGDGGDELLAGYNWHYNIAEVEQQEWFVKRLRFLKNGGYTSFISKKYGKVMGVPKPSDLRIFNDDFSYQMEKKRLRAYTNVFKRTGFMVKDMQWLDLSTFLPEPALTRADRMSMASSLEVRVPFLDHELFEFVYGLHPKSYFDPQIKKVLLAESLKKSEASFIMSLPKRGFSFQFMEAFKSTRVQNMIQNEVNQWPEIFNKEYDITNLSTLMNFKLLVFCLWLNKNM